MCGRQYANYSRPYGRHVDVGDTARTVLGLMAHGPQSVPAGRPGTSRPRALAAVLLATFSGNLTLTILTIALEPIARDLDVTVDDTAWLTLAPMIVAALLTPLSGRLADRFGRANAWRGGFALTTAGIALSAIAPELYSLIGARVLTGIGGGITFTSGLALVTSLYPAEERAKPVGLWTMASALSPTLGVLVGGALVDAIGWRALFWAQLPFCAVAWLLGVGLRDAPREQTAARAFDAAGAVLGGLLLFALLFGINRLPHVGWQHPLALVPLVASVLAVPVFVRIERRAEEPVFPLRFGSHAILRACLVGRGIIQAVYMGSFIVLPILLMDADGRALSAAEVSLWLVPRPLSMALVGPIMARYGDRIPAGGAAVTGAVLVTLGVAGLALLEVDTPYAFLLGLLVMKGLGLGLTHTGTGAIFTARAGDEDLGAASAAIALVATLGASVGMAVMLSAYSGPLGARGTFGLAAALSLVGVAQVVWLAFAMRQP